MSILLVSGCAGFIGSHFTDALIQEGHTVIGIDNLSSGKIENLNPNVIFYKKDVSDDLSDIFDQYKFDVVFHLAAQIDLRKSLVSPMEDAQTNIVGSLNVIENCIRTDVNQIIFSSTGGAIYCNKERLPWTEYSFSKPSSPYGLSKLTIEDYLQIMHNINGLSYTALRYANVYGPRQSNGYAGIISICIQNALKDETIYINGDGNQTRDFVFVKDVVNANMLAMEKKLQGTYNVASNTQVSVNEIANQVITLTKAKSKIEYKEAIIGETMHTRLSARKLHNATGWTNTVNLSYGMQETIEWFKGKK